MRCPEERSAKARKGVVLSFIAKGISFLVSLLVVPLTINYLNPSINGIWLALSSIIGWVAIMDLGLGNGFRNKFAESRATGDDELAANYLSTTYFALICLALILFPTLQLVNYHVDWASFLKVDNSYSTELRTVFTILSGVFCINLVANIFTMFLSADQRQGSASLVITIGQVLSLAALCILSLFPKGGMTKLSLFYSGIPCLTVLAISIIAYSTNKFKWVKPKISRVRPKLIKDIISLGLVFFFTNICVVLIFQLTNIVLSREIGPESVTQYNVAFKYFNIIYVAALIIVTPYWSAFTDAFTKKDKEWMVHTLQSLEKVAVLIVLSGIVLLAVSPVVYKIWLHDTVSVPFQVSVALLSYFAALTFSTTYTYLIAGIGKMRIQFVIYLTMAIISYPALCFFTRKFGIAGIVIMPIIVSLSEAVFCRIQLSKLICGTAEGWWNK